MAGAAFFTTFLAGAAFLAGAFFLAGAAFFTTFLAGAAFFAGAFLAGAFFFVAMVTTLSVRATTPVLPREATAYFEICSALLVDRDTNTCSLNGHSALHCCIPHHFNGQCFSGNKGFMRHKLLT